MAILQLHDQVVRDALRELAGREIKHTGDGIMASFFSAVAAARCANRIHRALALYEQEKKGIPIKVRIGAAAGEPVEDHMDLFGSTVQLAARLCSHAQPEQSLVSNVVAELSYTEPVMPPAPFPIPAPKTLVSAPMIKPLIVPLSPNKLQPVPLIVTARQR